MFDVVGCMWHFIIGLSLLDMLLTGLNNVDLVSDTVLIIQAESMNCMQIYLIVTVYDLYAIFYLH